MQFIVRDHFGFVVGRLKILVHRFPSLLPTPRKLLLWLLEPLLKASIPETDGLCLNLLRQIKGGDLGQDNLQMADRLLDLLAKNREWLDRIPHLIGASLYSYIRLLLDHGKFEALRQREVLFCVALLREKFQECALIGRDLVRLLQDVARIPEFQSVWDDLLNNPRNLSPHFAGIASLLAIPTPRRYLLSRISPQMEEQLLFVMEHVKMGNQRRYQQWFIKAFVSTPESESIVADIVRFICDVFHPPNHILCSDIVPRWAMIGWLLKCVKSPAVLASVKLALFYDWLFFDPAADSIMNIEPAILVMVNSLARYASITASLLEFLVLVVDSYFPPMTQVIRANIVTSFQTILSKGVVP